MSLPHRRLGATYRVQMAGLSFSSVADVIPYLADLGIETVYLSPLLRARSGSTHGYDVVSFDELDPAFGTFEDFEAMLGALGDAGMRLLLDIVPNHMAAAEENPVWSEVLRTGAAGPKGSVFDIDWPAGGGRVLLPVLGEPLAEAVEQRRFTLVTGEGATALAYGERRFPLADTGGLPEQSELDSASGEAYAAIVGDLLGRQHYRLAFWRLGRDERNYRRFFDIDDLVAVRIEDADVFEESHRFVLELVRRPTLAGLRVDHVDGLADPAGYLARLRSRTEDGGGGDARPAVLVEKILARGEELPEEWLTDGATGYEFAALAGGLFINGKGADALALGRASMTGDGRSFAERVVAAKFDVVERLFPADLDRVTRRLTAATASDPASGDISSRSYRQAIAALVAHLDVYRPYRLPGREPSPAESQRVNDAAAGAERVLDLQGRRALGILKAYLAGTATGPEGPGAARALAGLQQLSGAAMAKGAEDTAAYRPGRLLAAVDVGTDPDAPAVSVAEFHEAMVRRLERTPSGLNATSTHDSKRSEDVRARLSVLSEMPAAWLEHLAAFRRINEAHLRCRHGAPVPDAEEEIYLYETILGSLPLHGDPDPAYVSRIRSHMVKALREAKHHSSWTEPDGDYEEAVGGFVADILAPSTGAFAARLAEAADTVGPAGAANSLGLAVLRATAPGVPDTYQGSERWSLTLVDPDNREAVDFEESAAALRRLRAGGAPARSRLHDWRDGMVKLAVLSAALGFRRRQPGIFDEGAYTPLAVSGLGPDEVVAFARSGGGGVAVTAAVTRTRTIAGGGRFALGDDMAGGVLALPPGLQGELVDVLSGRRHDAGPGWIPLPDVFAELPVALLTDRSGPT